MSFAGARAQMVAELGNVSWVVPSTAAGIPVIGTKTAFDPTSIVTYIPQSEFKAAAAPLARVHIPNLKESRKTSGSDLVSQKLQTIRAEVYVYLVDEKRHGQGLTDYFDAVIDGILAYFRQHSGGGGTPTLVNNDILVAYALDQDARIDLFEGPPDGGTRIEYRGLVGVQIQMSIV